MLLASRRQLRSGLGCICLVEVDDRDRGPFLSKSLRDAKPNTARGARDQRNASVETTHDNSSVKDVVATVRQPQSL
jgi:hypothetical protein